MINRAVLVGRLTNDLEIKKTPNGVSVCNFTIACNRRYAAQGQERQADFINCVAWRQQADFIGRFARKGSLVGVEGSIQTRNYEGQDGRKVYVTEVVCDNVQLLESKSVTESRPQASNYGNNNYGNNNYGGNNYNNNNNNYRDANNMNDDFDLSDSVKLDISTDDLPF